MPADEYINLRIGPRTTVSIMFEGPLTQREITRLLAHLEAMLGDYPTPDEARVAELEKEGKQWHKPTTT